MSNTGLATITPKAATVLPRARNEAAEAVLKHADGVAGALSGSIDREAFKHACVVAANELEKDCTVQSVLIACYNAARIELPPGKQQGLAYFVPFKGECQLIVGYRGFIELAYRNAFLRQFHADVVYAGEDWNYHIDESGPRLRHTPDLERVEATGKTDSIIASYCVWTNSNGGTGVRIVPGSTIAKRYNDRSDAWRYYYHEQATKTAIRRAAKSWRMTPQLQHAVLLEDAIDTGVSQSSMVTVPGFAAIEPTKRDSLADAIDDADGAPSVFDRLTEAVAERNECLAAAANGALRDYCNRNHIDPDNLTAGDIDRLRGAIEADEITVK